MDLARLLEWQNLIFVLPVAFALLMLAISIFASLDGKADLDHAEADASVLGKALSAMGIGKVPLSILIFSWCMLFGFAGFVLFNFILIPMLPGTAISLIIAVPLAFFLAVFITGLLSGLLARFLPQVESYGERRQDFINREAEVRYTVTQSCGTVTLTDKYGNLQQLEVQLDSSIQEKIPPGTKVILTSYNAAEDVYTAMPARLLNALINQ